MKKIIFLLIVLSFLIAGCKALAEESLPNPGTLPDSSFYFLKSWKESIQTFFTFGAENKAKQFLHLADVRLAEYQKMIEMGKTDIALKTLEKYEKQLDQAMTKIKEAEEGGGTAELDTMRRDRRLKQQEILENISGKMSEAVKKTVVEERQKRWTDFILKVKERFPEAIPGPVGPETLPMELLFNCPLPSVPSPETCEVKWLISSVKNCPYFNCPSVGKTQAAPLPEKLAEPLEQTESEKPVESVVPTPAASSVATEKPKTPSIPSPKPVPAPVPVPAPAPTLTPAPISIPSPTPATRVACCNAGGGCKLVDAKETCLEMSGKPMSVSSCSPNPCPQPTPVYNECKQGPMKDYECPGGTLVKWQCECTAHADGEETRLCSVKPSESCPTGAAPLTITGIDVRHLLWMTKEWTVIEHIFWTTNIPATSYVEYGPTTSYGFTTSLSPESPKTQHVAEAMRVLEGTGQPFERNTTYHFRIIAEDTQGNKIVSQDYTFTTGL
jgi:hypothetical protein